MTIQSFQLDPASGGVSQATFDSHTHGYRKFTQIGVSKDHLYTPVERFDIVMMLKWLVCVVTILTSKQ